MSAAVQFYLATLVVLMAVDVLACWGLNLQFGLTGILNFAFIVLQAAGGYTVAVLTLGPASQNNGLQSYIGGARWPFPLPLVMSGVVGGVLAALLGLVVLRRLRRDYQAMVLLVMSLIATSVAENQQALFNGSSGLVLIPKPLQTSIDVSPVTYQWLYAAFCVAVAIIGFVFVQRLSKAPFGRTLRAIRDNEQVAAALGKDPFRHQVIAMALGGAMAGISGGLLVPFIGSWGPASWTYLATFLLLTAILVGGSGNNIGVLLGAVLVSSLFHEGIRFLPQIGFPGLTAAIQWMLVGVLTLAFLWFRPQGIVPERRRS